LLNEIIKYFGDFINDLLYIIKDKTLNAFEFSEENQQKYLLFHEKLLDPFEFISSNYKQQNLLEATGLYVAPKSINLGKREDAVIRDNKLQIVYKDDSFEYVSLYETLEKLLSNREFRLTLNNYCINQSTN
jgi:hypothetical protein